MNNSIRIAVCDDLKTERQKIILLLSSYLDQNNLYAEIDEFESGETFLRSDMTRYSLIFLDIFMGGLNGMETAKKIIQSNQKIQIVFASTSIDFAAEAFNIEALHYIVKPIRKEQVYSGSKGRKAGRKYLFVRYTIYRSKRKKNINSYENRHSGSITVTFGNVSAFTRR